MPGGNDWHGVALEGHGDTIVALSSGSVPSGVAVIRLSGPRVRFGLETVSGPVPEPRRASLRSIRSRDGSIIDSGLVLYFPAPNSFTGEECGEIQLHGSRAVVQMALNTLTELDGFRLADAGEFTRRAFENGRIDLTEVEGLADLIAAQTEMQRRLAREQASGGLTRLYSRWADRLLHARAMIEAELDFADEDDVPGSVSESVWADMQSLAGEMRAHLDAGSVAERVRDGFRIAITGRPNSGKSSLINALAKRDVAIVSDMAGTTRDVLSVDLDIAGYPATLYDTAGLRESDDRVEQEGVRRALKAISEADVVLHLIDLSDRTADASSAEKQGFIVGTKSDLSSTAIGFQPDVTISTHTGEGVDELIGLLRHTLEKRVDPGSLALPTRERHRRLIEESLVFLDEAVIDRDKPVELRAEALRLAAMSLDRITGRTDPEMLLDVVFSSFCIGK